MNTYELLTDEVYSLRKEGDGLRVTKFTKELNPVAFYHLTSKSDDSFTCNCPQSNRGPCKHLEIVEQFTFLYPERIDKGWFYCQQTGDWFPPIPEATVPPAFGVGEAGPSQAPASPGAAEVEGSMPPEPPSVAPKFRRF